jgi:hypothetical protein
MEPTKRLCESISMGVYDNTVEFEHGNTQLVQDDSPRWKVYAFWTALVVNTAIADLLYSRCEITWALFVIGACFGISTLAMPQVGFYLYFACLQTKRNWVKRCTRLCIRRKGC